MEARNRFLSDWLAMVRNGQIVLPRFQRFESWYPNLIENLLDNIINELPIGSFLVLGVSGEPPFVCRRISGAPEPQNVSELLLDGQQRLTALWRSLNDNYPDRTYFVQIPEQDEENIKPHIVSQSRWTVGETKYPLWVENPKECCDRRLIPLRILNPDNLTEYNVWAEKAANGNKDVQIRLIQLITEFRAKIAKYVIPFLYLEPNTPPETAIEVFIKLNTSYVKLTAFDIAVAQMEATVGESLHEMVAGLRITGIDRYIEPSELVLPVAALLQDKTPTHTNFIKLNYRKLRDDWNKIIHGAKKTVELLESESVLDSHRLPTESVIAPLVALWAESRSAKPSEEGNIRILLRKYLWRAFFTNRYDRAVSTAVLQDYRALKNVIENRANESEVPCFDENRYPLPSTEQLRNAGWPTRRDRLARAILLLSFRKGAEDIADGSKISPTNVGRREYHHVFPVDWFRRQGYEDIYDQAYRAVNCILITWRTNRAVGAKSPLEYLKELSGASLLGEEEIKRRVETHLINYDLLKNEKFEEFMDNRVEIYQKVISKLCSGKAYP